jgi:hypothetical protein
MHTNPVREASSVRRKLTRGCLVTGAGQLVALSIAVLLLGACAGSSGGPAQVRSTTTTAATGSVGPSTMVVADCSQTSTEPTRIIVACADAGYTLTDVTYTKWKDDEALGSAIVIVSHGDGVGRYNADFILDKPKDWAGRKLFSSLKVAYSGDAPTSNTTEVFDLTSTWIAAGLKQ